MTNTNTLHRVPMASEPLSGPDNIPFNSIFAQNASQQFALDTPLTATRGRAFRYSRAGGTNLTRAYMTQSEVPLSGLVDQVQTAYGASAGDTNISVLVTTGSGLTPANLVGGTLVVEELGTGDIGDVYTILNAAWKTSDTVLYLLLDTPIRNAIAATAALTLLKNRYADTIVCPTTQSAPASGVPLIDVTAKYYYWAQVRGPTPLMVYTAAAVGSPIGPSANTAGASAPALSTASTYVNQPIWGVAMQAGTQSKVGLAWLNLCD